MCWSRTWGRAGQVELKLKTRWRDGTTHLVMSPLEFMQRLAALVPRPRLQPIWFHGVMAPNAKLRALVVPQGPEVAEPAAEAPLRDVTVAKSKHLRPPQDRHRSTPRASATAMPSGLPVDTCQCSRSARV
ncbi:MAG: transposase [Betaproteobacteria bacterium]|nr:transposase [Betaproteobacteria bacterium]